MFYRWWGLEEAYIRKENDRQRLQFDGGLRQPKWKLFTMYN